MNPLKIRILSPNVQPPEYATVGSAGMDLCANLDDMLAIAPGAIVRVPTGLAIALPDSEHVAIIAARSGLAVRHGIALANGIGVIDSDYRGEILVGLINQSDRVYEIEPGERIAQMLIMPVCRPTLEVCESLCETQRSTGGFGSTGRL